MRKRHWSYQGEKNRLIVLERDGRQCQIRGPKCLGMASTVDHIIPRGLGGPDILDNLRAACVPCNSGWRREGDAPQGGPFFRDVAHTGGAVRNTSPRRPWDALRADEWRKRG